MEDKVYAPILKTINTDDVKINFITETFPVNFSEIRMEMI